MTALTMIAIALKDCLDKIYKMIEDKSLGDKK